MASPPVAEVLHVSFYKELICYWANLVDQLRNLSTLSFHL